MQAEICPKCGVRQAPVSAPQGPAASAEPQQAAGVKFCATCGASINSAAEICPKCGVRQAPPSHAAQGAAANVAQQAGAFFNGMTQEMRSTDYRAWFKKLTTTKGRASRKEFAAVAILPWILLLLFSAVAGLVGTRLGIELSTIQLLVMIVYIPYGLVCLLCTVRRLHDMNLTGWFALLIGIITNIFTAALAEEKGYLFSLVPIAVVMIVLAAIPGTAGSNKYGEPPK